MTKMYINAGSVKREEKKMQSIINYVKRTGKKSPRMAAEFMVRNARAIAPVDKGILKKNINSFKRGRNSYEVISHRFPRAGESPRRDFPVHAWIDGRRNVGGWKKGPYTGKCLGYFTKAAGKTRFRFFKMFIRDVRKGLSIKI